MLPDDGTASGMRRWLPSLVAEGCCSLLMADCSARRRRPRSTRRRPSADDHGHPASRD
ncbi:hypothetical protein SLNHY_3673 [Streptomyces albus]|nr:hypothetical protein SLNHY_3673 [Streptomyces albus]